MRDFIHTDLELLYQLADGIDGEDADPGAAQELRDLDVMSRDVVLAPARNDTVPIQEVSVQTACH